MDIDKNMYSMFREFVRERHQIYTRRQMGVSPQYWTNNPLLWRKYTNVFRFLDPGSQYVIKMLQEEDLAPGDALARAFLYRYTNRPQAWDAMKEVLGRWPLASDMTSELADGLVYLRETMGVQIFSGAYVIMPAPNTPGDKVRHALALAQRVTHPDSPQNVLEKVVGAATPRAAFDALRAHNGVGNFMAMQILTDFGYYWPEWDENAFVIAGPGSLRGAAHVAPKARAEDVIAWVQEDLIDRADMPWVGDGEYYSRILSRMDIQNCFCEFSKYIRALKTESVPARPYQPKTKTVEPIFPTHW